MADRFIKVLEPAESYDLVTLAELKVALGIASADVSSDAALEQMIKQYSDDVSERCNRVFAREKVQETWRELGQGRLFLSHYPVTEEDIVSVESPRGVPITDYELEEKSGKLSVFNGCFNEPVVVVYTGGYELPDDAPPALKQVTTVMIRAGRSEAAREATAGIRSISHKDARVMYFDPNAGASKSTSAPSTSVETIRALLAGYIRYEV